MTDDNPLGRPPNRGAAARWATSARLLLDTLAAHDVDLTSQDSQTVDWISGWEPQTVRTIASWIVRAAAAARGQASKYRG